MADLERRSFIAGLLATALAPAIPLPREVVYHVFEDIPLEKFGNRMPQVGDYAVLYAVAGRQLLPPRGWTALGQVPQKNDHLHVFGRCWDGTESERPQAWATPPRGPGERVSVHTVDGSLISLEA